MIRDVVLRLHIAAGVVALAAGFVAVVTTKGGQYHRRAGRVYVAAMGVVVTTVLPLFAFEPRQFSLQFLLLVAVFSGYLAFSGYRVLARKRPGDAATPVDWTAACGVVLACLGLAAMGGSLLLERNSFGAVLVVFGSIGGYFGIADIRQFRRGDPEWVIDHLTRMVGAYIATVTAVVAVNVTRLPAAVAWLLPTAVGVPLIVYWQHKYGPE